MLEGKFVVKNPLHNSFLNCRRYLAESLMKTLYKCTLQKARAEEQLIDVTMAHSHTKTFVRTYNRPGEQPKSWLGYIKVHYILY